MATTDLALLLSAGILLGAIGGWLAAKFAVYRRINRVISDYQAEIAALKERLRHKQSETEGLQKELAAHQQELKALNSRFLEACRENGAALARIEQLAPLQQRLQDQAQEIKTLQRLNSGIENRQTELETLLAQERMAATEKISLLEDLRHQWLDTFKALSASALRENNRTFIDLADSVLAKHLETARKDLDVKGRAVEELVGPIRDSLTRFDHNIQSLERTREKAYGGLSEQVRSLIGTQQLLQRETGKLVKALQTPQVRGRWGEITLRRVAELSGMQRRCDFFEQQTAAGADGLMRPDMLVKLPGNRQIVVDAKVPLAAYLDSLEAESDQARQALLETHGKQVQTHILKLSQKAYWTQFAPTPEFVVLFIPGENFFSAALSQNPALIEEGAQRGVILATPTTLISLLKAIAFGWRQETITENARAISALGRELYERLNHVAGHLNRLGQDIDHCARSFNQAVGSLEQRVFASARRFAELGIRLKDNRQLPELETLNRKTRKLDEDKPV
ncbi:MAG: DNA recombination protein RmuC [Desulfobacterales bacterium]